MQLKYSPLDFDTTWYWKFEWTFRFSLLVPRCFSEASKRSPKQTISVVSVAVQHKAITNICNFHCTILLWRNPSEVDGVSWFSCVFYLNQKVSWWFFLSLFILVSNMLHRFSSAADFDFFSKTSNFVKIDIYNSWWFSGHRFLSSKSRKCSV